MQGQGLGQDWVDCGSMKACDDAGSGFESKVHAGLAMLHCAGTCLSASAQAFNGSPVTAILPPYPPASLILLKSHRRTQPSAPPDTMVLEPRSCSSTCTWVGQGERGRAGA